ncbi:MAG: hypothetical protein AB1327_00165 [Bacillota bacterium]
MSYKRRLELLRGIGELRQTAVITFFTGDRENVSTRIAPDAVPVFYRHLRQASPARGIDLFLYTRGGDVLTPWRLVHLFREFAPRFSVLVPFRAYSAGTLLCLGADEILMTPLAELGPIDPSVVNAFNPQDPVNPAARIPVNVEDVYAYLALVREEALVRSEPFLTQAFLRLAETIHPLALGNVHRNYNLVRSLAKRLLAMPRNRYGPEQVQHIVDSLTQKLYAHNHMISRQEAGAEIGLNVVKPDGEMESLIWELYEEYRARLRLDEPFDPAALLAGASCAEFEVAGGFIESAAGQDAYVFRGTVERREFPDRPQINVNIVQQGWRMTRGGTGHERRRD